jgi:hypothetical protein
MAQLNSSNVVNGNTIATTDILQLYDALTAGGGTTGVYNISISGSITGSASTAATATTATSASNITVSTTSSGVYYPVVVSGVGTNPPKVVSIFELSGSVLNNITSSRAITASYALNASVSQVDGQRYISSANPLTVDSGNFKFIAGGGILNSGVLTSSAYAPLAGKTMGQNAWVTVTYTGDLGAITSPSPTLGVNLSSSGAILIKQLTAQNDVEVVWTGMYI